MATIDLTPLYRNSIGFDRLASILNATLSNEHGAASYPPYNIEALDNDRYTISLALAGFSRDELEIQVENGVLSVSGKKADDSIERQYLYQGIANRAFERRFNLAEYVEVTDASMDNGLLTISLERQLPEAMKPRRIAINSGGELLEHQQDDQHAA